jgi:tetratricopeptide (TPR) repeat protein
MPSNRSAYLAIGLPLALLFCYLWVAAGPGLQEAESAPITPEESSKLWAKCNTLVRAGKYSEALPGALKLYELYPGNHIYIEMVAEVYDHLGQFDREAEFWEQYLDRAPNPVTGCPQIGQSYWKQGKRQQAVAAFERCLAYDPENSDSIFFLAHALELSGQVEHASELYARGVKIAPGYADLQLGLARFHLRKAQDDVARDIALRILRDNPRNTDALLVAGLAFTRESRLVEAREYLNQGVKLSDGYLDFHYALARLDELESKPGDALREYDRILQDRPDDAEARAKRDALLVRQ